jgi:hypothetical protein
MPGLYGLRGALKLGSVGASGKAGRCSEGAETPPADRSMHAVMPRRQIRMAGCCAASGVSAELESLLLDLLAPTAPPDPLDARLSRARFIHAEPDPAQQPILDNDP